MAAKSAFQIQFVNLHTYLRLGQGVTSRKNLLETSRWLLKNFDHSECDFWSKQPKLRHWPHLQPMQATPLLTASDRILSSVARLLHWKNNVHKCMRARPVKTMILKCQIYRI